VDLDDDAYQIAKTVAREQHRSLGKVISDFVTGQFNQPGAPLPPEKEEVFPTFRCARRVTSADVKALDEDVKALDEE
jgi:hypothetical protein